MLPKIYDYILLHLQTFLYVNSPRILTISGQIPEDEYDSDLNREYFLTVDQFSSYRRIIGSWFESPLRYDKGRNRTIQYRYRTFTVLYRTVPYVGFADIKVPYRTVP